jgi:hypothetical protein
LFVLGDICLSWAIFVCLGRYLFVLGDICLSWAIFACLGRYLFALGEIWSQSYDLRIYNYSASVVVGRWVFFKVGGNVFAFKTHQATRGVVNFYHAGVVTHGGRIGS